MNSSSVVAAKVIRNVAPMGYEAPPREVDHRSETTLKTKAQRIIDKVDQSHIFSVTERRYFPTFARDEVKIGPILGTGGFCVVREVLEFRLHDNSDNKPQNSTTSITTSRQSTSSAPAFDDGGTTEETTTTTTAPTTEATDAQVEEQENLHPEANGPKDNNVLELQDNSNNGPSNNSTETSPTAQDDEEEEQRRRLEDDQHYAVETAREQMVQRCRSDGEQLQARYAVKRLRRDLSPAELTRAMIDLAIEAKFLSALWHPNIVKMRGVAADDAIMTIDYFIVLDRLYGTLNNKMRSWIVASSKAGGLLGIGKNKMMLNDLMVERLLVAYDLAAAFRYIHDHKLVYRDIKPENIGFDFRGDVKVFDFGLCKSLEPELKVIGGYLLTARTGSIPYMAPEVALSKPYDTKCDVFSFSILLWEILAMKPAFKGMTKKEFLNRVILGSERLPVPTKPWPPFTRNMLKSAWHPDPSQRPNMKSIATLIRNDLTDMCKDDAVLHRTQHMADRSQHSQQIHPLGRFIIQKNKTNSINNNSSAPQQETQSHDSVKKSNKGVK